MRTIIYIDGFNFYYGCVQKTSYKWLNLKALCESMLSDENKIVEIKYFTAKVKDTRFKPNVRERQQNYFDALENYIPEMTICDEGYFSMGTKHLRRTEYPHDRVEVFKPEEKGSDVNLATHMLNDAWLDKYDCAVLISNDSDMVGSMQLIKKYHPEKVLGLMTPAFAKKRRTSELLKKEADFVKRIDRESLLKKCQLPNPVIDKKTGKVIRKPPEW